MHASYFGGLAAFDHLGISHKIASENVVALNVIRLGVDNIYNTTQLIDNQGNIDYSQLETVVWCQEEPKNQGAWYNSQHRLRRVLDLINKDLPLSFAGRLSSASPAAGYMALHLEQQENLIAEALGL